LYVGTNRLQELSSLAEEVPLPTRPIRLTIVIPVTQTPAEFLTHLNGNIQEIETFLQTHARNFRLELLEIPIPPEITTQIEKLHKYYTSIIDKIPPTVQIFIEGRYATFETVLTTLIYSLASFNHQKLPPHSPPLGFKLRTGGVTADAIPPTEFIAQAIYESQDADLSLKATAGLHHPIRHYDTNLGVRMHGFLNIIGATLLAKHFQLSKDVIIQILNTENPNDFQFSKQGFMWKDYKITTAEIEALRNRSFHSFGSCDFNDPRVDLKALSFNLSISSE